MWAATQRMQWAPIPPLPRARARAVACGSSHVVVLLDDATVVQLETPPPLGPVGLPAPAAAEAGHVPSEASQGPGLEKGRTLHLEGCTCTWRLLRPSHADATSAAAAASLASACAAKPATNANEAPAPAHEVSVAIAAGAWHSLIVGESGGLWACGADACGQLGIGGRPRSAPSRDAAQTTTAAATAPPLTASAPVPDLARSRAAAWYHPLPVRVVTPLRAFHASGGGHHSLVLTHSGSVLSFGLNASGQLGLGTLSRRATTAADAPHCAYVAPCHCRRAAVPVLCSHRSTHCRRCHPSTHAPPRAAGDQSQRSTPHGVPLPGGEVRHVARPTPHDPCPTNHASRAMPRAARASPHIVARTSSHAHRRTPVTARPLPRQSAARATCGADNCSAESSNVQTLASPSRLAGCLRRRCGR